MTDSKSATPQVIKKSFDGPPPSSRPVSTSGRVITGQEPTITRQITKSNNEATNSNKK